MDGYTQPQGKTGSRGEGPAGAFCRLCREGTRFCLGPLATFLQRHSRHVLEFQYMTKGPVSPCRM